MTYLVFVGLPLLAFFFSLWIEINRVIFRLAKQPPSATLVVFPASSLSSDEERPFVIRITCSFHQDRNTEGGWYAIALTLVLLQKPDHSIPLSGFFVVLSSSLASIKELLRVRDFPLLTATRLGTGAIVFTNFGVSVDLVLDICLRVVPSHLLFEGCICHHSRICWPLSRPRLRRKRSFVKDECCLDDLTK